MTLQIKQPPIIKLLVDITFLALEMSEGPRMCSIELNFVVISLVFLSQQPGNAATNIATTCEIYRDPLSKQHHHLLSSLPNTPRSDPPINSIDTKNKRIR